MAHNKQRIKKQIIEELENVPIPFVVCRKLGVSKATFYRWLGDDIDFKTSIDKATERGRSNINELAESKLIQKLDNGENWAISYWLGNNSERYIKPRKPIDNTGVNKSPKTIADLIRLARKD